MRVDLPYGKHPYPVDLSDDREVRLVLPPALPTPPPLDELLRAATSTMPTASVARVVVIISDPSRHEPREAFVRAVRHRLPSHTALTIAIATGTHGPCRVEDLGLSPDTLAGASIVNHNGHQDRDLVELGVTSRGTPVRVHRCLVDADLVIATGCIRPHYFAGFGAGVKALFPGLGQATAIRINHLLKTHPDARAGVVVGNPCRDDLEEAARFIPTPVFLLDGVCGPDDRIHHVVSGDMIRAFREGAELARPWFTAQVPGARVVIASDALPITASLYQAAKIAAAAAPLVDEGGTLVVVAECANGIGPIEVVNEAIFRIGVLPRLAPDVRLVLVSSLDETRTRQTLLDYAPSVEHVLGSTTGPIVVIPRASQLICERRS